MCKNIILSCIALTLCAGLTTAKTYSVDEVAKFPKKYERKLINVDMVYMGESKHVNIYQHGVIPVEKYFHMETGMMGTSRQTFSILISRKNKRVISQISQVKNGQLLRLRGSVQERKKIFYLDVKSLLLPEDRLELQEKAYKRVRSHKPTALDATEFMAKLDENVDEFVKVNLTLTNLNKSSKASRDVGFALSLPDNVYHVASTEINNAKFPVYLMPSKDVDAAAKILKEGDAITLHGEVQTATYRSQPFHWFTAYKVESVALEDSGPVAATQSPNGGKKRAKRTGNQDTMASAAPTSEPGTPANALENFYKDGLKAGSLAVAIPPAARQKLKKLYGDGLFKHHSMGRTARNFSVEGSYTQGEKRYIIGRLHFDDGLSRPIVHVMEKDSLGEWRIIE